MSESVPDTVVLFATADWNAPCWTNKQHIAKRLAERGTRVLYVESVGIRRPSVNSTDLSRILRRLRTGLRPPRQVEERIWALSPLTIPMGRRSALVKAFNIQILRYTVSAWLKRHGKSRPVIWTYHPYMLEAIDGLEHAAMVYHCVDNLASIPGVDARAFDAAEEQLLTRANAVFTTSHALQKHCLRIASDKTAYFPNVADPGHFAVAREPGPIPADLEAIPHPRLGFVGALTDFKIDFLLLEQIARTHPEWHLALIGAEREGQDDPVLRRMRTMPNVHFLGWRPYDQLPDYLRGIDVALLPLLCNTHTEAVFPMKFFEYLDAGKPVVATRLSSLDEFDSCCVRCASTEEFLAAIGQAILEPLVIPLSDPVLQTNTWDARLDGMLAFLAQRAGS